MSLTAKLYIAAIIAGGLVCLGYGLEVWTCRDPFTYLCLLGLAVGTSLLKVTIPGRHTNLSVGFIVVLLSIIDFSYPETLVVGCLAAAVQAVWRKKHLNAIQFLFNLSTVAIAASVGYVVHHGLVGTLSMVTSIAIAAIAYFLANTIMISAVIGLTTSTNVYKTWRECHSWLLPYYLLGVGAIVVLAWRLQCSCCRRPISSSVPIGSTWSAWRARHSTPRMSRPCTCEPLRRWPWPSRQKI